MANWKEKRQYQKAQMRFIQRQADGFTKESCQKALDVELEVMGYLRPELEMDGDKFVGKADPTTLDTSKPA